MDAPVTVGPQPSPLIKRKKPISGILSCVAVLITIILYILAFIIGFPEQAFAPEQGIEAGLSVANLIFYIFLATIASSFISTIGLTLGIIGIVQKNRSKVFAIIGTAINGLMLSCFLFLLIMIRLSRN